MKKFLTSIDVILLICSAKEPLLTCSLLMRCLLNSSSFKHLHYKCLPDWHVHEKIFVVMVHHECVIKEDCSIGHIGYGDQVPDNVLEHVMGTPHLDQVLGLL